MGSDASNDASMAQTQGKFRDGAAGVPRNRLAAGLLGKKFGMGGWGTLDAALGLSVSGQGHERQTKVRVGL